EIATLRKVRNPDGSVLSLAQAAEVVDESSRLDAIVVIADFGEPVFPGLRRLGTIARVGDKPAHVVTLKLGPGAAGVGARFYVLRSTSARRSARPACQWLPRYFSE